MTGLADRYHEEIVQGRLKPDPAQERAVEALQKMEGRLMTWAPPSASSWFSAIFRQARDETAPQGVYLYGPVGRGKTRIMDLFFNTLPESVKKRRVHFHAFMLSVHDFMHRARQAGGAEGVDDILPKFAVQTAEQAQLLCFDEFHVVDVADAMILSRLMRALFEAGVSVVITSNWRPDDLYKKGIQRNLFLPFIDLVKARLDVVAVDGACDYRMAAIAGRPVYFYPNGIAAQTALRNFFRDMTAMETGAPVNLDVMGHTVTIPFTGYGVAWASFSDLCEKPLAAQDYLELARCFHTLMIDRVPRLTYDRRNETKRFMILVDILYEHRRRLIVAAEAAPDKLLIDSEYAFEFQRTISRLVEMQGADYLDHIEEEIE